MFTIWLNVFCDLISSHTSPSFPSHFTLPFYFRLSNACLAFLSFLCHCFTRPCIAKSSFTQVPAHDFLLQEIFPGHWIKNSATHVSLFLYHASIFFKALLYVSNSIYQLSSYFMPPRYCSKKYLECKIGEKVDFIGMVLCFYSLCLQSCPAHRRCSPWVCWVKKSWKCLLAPFLKWFL